MEKDFAELKKDDIPNSTLTFLEKDNLMKFEIVFDIKDECLWKGGKYKFRIEVTNNYPMEAPKVHLETPIYHPNIDTQGNVCLNILRQDWKPVLNIYAVLTGLSYLFVEPNPNDPLNHEAASVLRQNPSAFARNVNDSLMGRTVDGVKYPRML